VKGDLVKSSVQYLVKAVCFVVTGVAIAAGIDVDETDDAPGASLAGLLLMIDTVVLGVRTALRKA
jgi:hypothetical protein